MILACDPYDDVTAIDASFAAAATSAVVDRAHFAAAAADCRSVQHPNCYGSPQPPIRCTRQGTIRTIVFVDFRQIANLWHVRPPKRYDRARGTSIDFHPMPDTSIEHEPLDVGHILWLQMTNEQ